MDTEIAADQSRNLTWSGVFVILFVAFLAMTACVSMSVGYSVHRYWENALVEEITRSLTQKAQMFAGRVNAEGQRPIGELTSEFGQEAGARATVIDVNGKVVADSEIAVASLEGDGRHPEFVAALRGEIGVDKRKRSAFGIPILFVAVPVAGGAVRLAYPLADVSIAASQSRTTLLYGLLAAVISALAISALGSAAIVRRVRRIQ
jgi:two-component system, OmpR family, phosphate regulon sensor histidine kinase PhoR